MTDNSELKRLAEHHLSLGQAYTVAKPSVLLALIAENERLGKERITEHQSLRSDRARNSLYMMIATSLIDDHPYERGGSDWDYEHPIHDKIISLLAERDQLRAEVAGLRTGYEAYEQVNAELKAEVEELRRERAGKILCDLELFETLRDSANTEADEHRQCMATYRPLRQASLDSVVKKCDDLLAALGQGEQS